MGFFLEVLGRVLKIYAIKLKKKFDLEPKIMSGSVLEFHFRVQGHYYRTMNQISRTQF